MSTISSPPPAAATSVPPPIVRPAPLGPAIDQLRGEVPLSDPPPMYAIATGLSAIVLLLLPVIYIGLVGLVGWLTATHLIYNLDLLTGSNVHVISILIYLLPAFIGIVLFIFMIKPLFRWGHEDDVIETLEPEKEPELYAYVHKLCDLLDAPRPHQIDVDLRVNASASLGTGLGLLSNKLVLTLGLPLINGLNLTQFTGVLAHELGHFTQSKSLRMANWIRSINVWFIRVVHERDALDEKLVQWSDHGPAIFQWIFGIARFFVWVTRRILHLFMMLGHAASCFVARQAEFDADQFQAHTSGSKAFSSTMHKIYMMDMAHGATIDALEMMWREKRLGDNLPDLVVAKARETPKDKIQPLIRLLLAARTRWHDTHPSFKDRLQHARQLKATGIIQDARPARELFSDFRGLCRRQTIELYRLRLGKDFTEKNLVPAEDVVREWSATSQAFKSLRRFYQDAVLMTRPTFPFADARMRPSNPPEALNQLKDIRDRMMLRATHAAETTKRYDETERKLLLARQAHNFTSIGLGIDAASYEIDEPTSRGVSKAIERLNSQKHDTTRELEDFDELARQRMTLGLQLLQLGRVASRLPDGTGAALRARTATLLTVCDKLEEAMEDVHNLRESFVIMMDMLNNLGLAKDNPRFVERALKKSRDMAHTMGEIRTRFAEIPYPFDHFGDEKVSIATFIQDKQPDPEMPGDVTAAAADLLDRLESILARSLAQLAAAAEQVETALGFPPLKDPPESDDFIKAVEEIEKAESESSGMKATLASAWNGTVQIGASIGMLAIVGAAIWAFGWLASEVPKMASERKEQRRQTQYNPPSHYQPPSQQPWHTSPANKDRFDPTKPYQPPQPNYPQPPKNPYQPSQPNYPKPPTSPRPSPSPSPHRPSTPRPGGAPSSPRPGPGK